MDRSTDRQFFNFTEHCQSSWLELVNYPRSAKNQLKCFKTTFTLFFQQRLTNFLIASVYKMAKKGALTDNESK